MSRGENANGLNYGWREGEKRCVHKQVHKKGTLRDTWEVIVDIVQLARERKWRQQ
jgi:hypothetical protein